MMIDRPELVCVYCERPVRERWHLWCDVCYMRLVHESVNIECERLAIEKLRCEGGVLKCRDRAGVNYEFRGCHWRRCGK